MLKLTQAISIIISISIACEITLKLETIKNKSDMTSIDESAREVHLMWSDCLLSSCGGRGPPLCGYTAPSMRSLSYWRKPPRGKQRIVLISGAHPPSLPPYICMLYALALLLFVGKGWWRGGFVCAKWTQVFWWYLRLFMSSRGYGV